MNPLPTKRKFFSLSPLPMALVVLAILLMLGGCTYPGFPRRSLQTPPGVEKAEILFSVTSLRPLLADETVEVVILDEVTGLPFNSQHIPMTLNASGQLEARYQAPVGTVLIYRYEKITGNGARIPEVTISGTPVRYRMYHIATPAKFEESIAGWEDNLPVTDNLGTITGQIVTADLGFPVRDMLVSAGGLQTITDADGRFTLYPLSAGRHNLAAISMTGSYLPFQNTADVAAGKVTMADIKTEATSFKQVTFIIDVPEDTIDGAPVRMAGNLTQLGNTFIDLGGGMSGDTKQMPQLVKTKDGYFTTTLSLPAGIDIRYKFTMGDGFWNSEHGMDNTFVTHQLILKPDGNAVTVQDNVFTWKTSDTETIWFRVTVPQSTPAEEDISIQFSLGTWMPSLPMFKIRENTWAFPLIGPHNFSGELPYRYCRNTPCTGVIQAGIENLEPPRSTSTKFMDVHLINDSVSEWAFLTPATGDTSPLANITPRSSEFLTGLALTPYYSPTGLPYFSSLVSGGQKPYNHIVISPAWQAKSPTTPQMFGPTLQNTIRWNETISEIRAAHDKGLTVSLFPQVLFSSSPLAWWEAFPSDTEAYWQTWLDQYREFVYQYAVLAEESGAEAFILGGAWLTPALPVGDNPDTYNLPGNIESLWSEIIAGVRERYHGKIGWQLTTDVAEDPPAFLSRVDILFYQWDIPAEPYNDTNELSIQIGGKLDEIAGPLKTSLEKPLYIVVAYPSISGYTDTCISSPNDEGGCINTHALLIGPSVENPALTDLAVQADYYRALLTAVDQRSWVDGVLSQGYYPANQIHDTSASIHGKPAETIFENWAAQVLGK